MIKKLERNYSIVLDDVIDKQNEIIDAVNKSEPKEEWPKEGDRYWFFNSGGEICFWDFGSNYKGHTERKDLYNCFRTKVEAESARDKVKELLKSLQK